MCDVQGSKVMWPRLSPYARGQPAEEEGAVSLDEGREEGEHAVDGQWDEERLSSSDPVSQAAPHKGADHHAQVHDQAWRGGATRSQEFSRWVRGGGDMEDEQLMFSKSLILHPDFSLVRFNILNQLDPFQNLTGVLK